MHDLCNALARMPGLGVEVVTTDAAGTPISERIPVQAFPVRLDAGYDVYYCRRRMFISISPELLRMAWKRIRRADVVHLSATYSFPTLPVLAMARLLSKPVMWTPHGALIPWHSTRKAWVKHLWNRACRLLLDPRGTMIHVASEREAASTRAVMPGIEVKVIPFGMDIPSGKREPRRRDRALRLLFVGRLDPIKALDNLLHALAEDGAQEATLSICGTGERDYAESLKRLSSNLALESRIRFHGHVDGETKEAQFAQADALVLPSHSENFGLVVIEALARAVPVIASKGTPWGEIEAQGCGIWTDNSAGALAAAIHSLGSRDLLAMGERGRLWVSKRFSWPSVASEMAAAYDELRERVTVSRAASTNKRTP